jgi:hypothetical protein
MKHRWTANYEVEGGCRENPGVWGIGGAAIAIREHCVHCGSVRRRVVGDVDTPTRNHGWRYESGDTDRRPWPCDGAR